MLCSALLHGPMNKFTTSVFVALSCLLLVLLWDPVTQVIHPSIQAVASGVSLQCKSSDPSMFTGPLHPSSNESTNQIDVCAFNKSRMPLALCLQQIRSNQCWLCHLGNVRRQIIPSESFSNLDPEELINIWVASWVSVQCHPSIQTDVSFDKSHPSKLNQQSMIHPNP